MAYDWCIIIALHRKVELKLMQMKLQRDSKFLGTPDIAPPSSNNVPFV